MASLPMKHHFLERDHPLHNHFLHRRGSTAMEDFQMGGNIYPVGIYWISVGLGTPVQSLLAAVDSGSSDLIVPSPTCEGCHLQNTGSFDVSASSTVSEIRCTNSTLRCRFPCSGQCEFKDSYQTCDLTDPQAVCSVSGGLYTDVYTQGDFSSTVVFGLIESQTANFQQFYVIDGVIGFAFNGGSSWNGVVPFQRLVDEGQVADQFAMCMQPSAGGVLTLGGVDPNLYTGDFQYTPLQRYIGQYILYVLNATDISVGSTSIGLPAIDYERYGTMGGCVLDSGTNTILLPSQIYTAFESTFNAYWSSACAAGTAPEGVCNEALLKGQCYSYTTAERESFPDINMTFSNVTLTMTGTDYIVANSTDSNAQYCMGVLNTGAGGNFIVGDVLMQNYYVLFDRENKQIGWATPQIDNCIGLDEPIYYWN